MTALTDFATQGLVEIHLVGVSLVVGPFLMQLRRKSGFSFAAMRIGAMILVASGGGLVATHVLWGIELDTTKIMVKAAVAVLVLALLIVARVRQRNLIAGHQPDAPLRVFLFAAGALAIVDVIVAVSWN